MLQHWDRCFWDLALRHYYGRNALGKLRRKVFEQDFYAKWLLRSKKKVFCCRFDLGWERKLSFQLLVIHTDDPAGPEGRKLTTLEATTTVLQLKVKIYWLVLNYWFFLWHILAIWWKCERHLWAGFNSSAHWCALSRFALWLALPKPVLVAGRNLNFSWSFE